MAKQVGPALARLPGEPRPLRGETDWLRGGEAEDAVVSEGVGVGAQRVAAHRYHQVLSATDDGHETLRVVGFRKDLGNQAGLYEALERRTSRYQVRPVADVALELPGRNPAQLEEALLEAGFVEARPGEALGENRAQEQERLLTSHAHAHGEHQLPANLSHDGVGEVGEHALRRVAEHRGDDAAPGVVRDGDGAAARHALILGHGGPADAA